MVPPQRWQPLAVSERTVLATLLDAAKWPAPAPPIAAPAPPPAAVAPKPAPVIAPPVTMPGGVAVLQFYPPGGVRPPQH
jgi:hypothetical protein